jgi:hypothetical protein
MARKNRPHLTDVSEVQAPKLEGWWFAEDGSRGTFTENGEVTDLAPDHIMLKAYQLGRLAAFGEAGRYLIQVAEQGATAPTSEEV